MGRDGKDLIRWLWERCRSENAGTPCWDSLVRTARKSGVSLAALLLAIQGTAGMTGCDGGGGDGDDTTTPKDTVTDTPHGEDLVYAIMALDISSPEDTVTPPEDTPIAILPPVDVVTPEDTIYAIMPPMDTVDADIPPLEDVPLPEDMIWAIMPPMDIVPQDTPPPPDIADIECKGDADCPEGMECDLPECPPGMFCILPPEPPSGICVPEEATPTECWTDEDCPPGEVCEGASICPPDTFCILADSPGSCEEAPPPEKPGFAAADSRSWRGLVEDAVRTFTAASEDDDEPHVV